MICQYCKKEINPISIGAYGNLVTVKYHEGCKRKVNAERSRRRKRLKDRV